MKTAWDQSWRSRLVGVPTGLLVSLVAVPMVASLAVLVTPAAIAPVIALDVVLALVAMADLWFTRSEAAVSREIDEVQSVGRPFPVALRISLAHAGELSVVDDCPGEPTGLPAHTTLDGPGEVEVSYETVVGVRGAHSFGAVSLRVRSPLGLWMRQIRVDLPESIRVYPDFGRLRSWGVDAKISNQRAPVRARRKPGGDNDFQRLRPYVAGDPYRHIDWRATARRNEFVTREFGQESNQNLIFLLDAGRMMSGAAGELTAFDHALNAAVMMGQVALRHGDRVGLLAFDKDVRVWMPPKSGARSGGRLIRGTYDLFPSLEEPDFAMAFRYLTQRVRRRSLVVLLTTVVDQVNADMALALTRALGSRHLPMAVWLRDPELDELAHGEPDPVHGHYPRGAAAEILAWRAEQLTMLKKRGALVVDCQPSELTSELLGRYLEIKARRML